MTSFLHLTYRESELLRSKERQLQQTRNHDYLRLIDLHRTLDVQLRNRSAYPSTYCQLSSNREAWLGYGPRYPSKEDEFLRIHIDLKGTIRIERDMYCTLPLFYGFSQGVFVLSNTYDEVCTALPRLTLHREGLMHHLWDPFTHLATLWKEVGVLGPRETLVLKNGALEKIVPPKRSWKYNTELTPSAPGDFAHFLEERLEHFIETHFRGGQIGFEVSGGMDSSLLPLYLGKRGYVTRLPAGALVVPGASGKWQRNKLQALESYCPIDIHRVLLEPQRHYPLKQVLEAPILRPLFIKHELYDAAFVQVADHLKAQGVDIMARGTSGDQTFEHIPHPDILTSFPIGKAPAFLKGTYSKGENIFAELGKHLLSYSSPLEHLGSANIYIERDIWPVSPFNDLELYEFCQALPLKFRSNKAIFRAYFEANRFPEVLYKGPNESFSDFFTECMRLPIFQNLITYLAKESITEKLGLINIPLLRKAYQEICDNHPKDEVPLAIHDWICTEMELQLRLSTTRASLPQFR